MKLMILDKIIILLLIAFLVNIPLGYWRRDKKKFSLSWYVLIHASIPLIYILRKTWGITFSYVPFFVTFAIFGQVLGSKKLWPTKLLKK